MSLKKKSMSLSTLVMLAFGVGIAVGLFFGEGVAFLQPIGNAYIGLLQMTVLPYIVLSLLSGLGNMQPAMARQLARIGITTLLVIWAIGLVAMLLMPLSYPDWESARFFSSSLVKGQEQLDILALYIPNNPFAVLAEAIVPATVVFSILLGIAMMQVEKKSALMETIEALGDAVMRLAGMVVKTAPIGIFALAAAAAGTIRVEQFQAIQVYVWGYFAMWLVLTFVALPGVISVLTGASYRSVFRHTRDALVTGFATGSLLVILPLLSEGLKNLLAELGEDSEESQAAANIVLPIAFNVPAVTSLLGLSFVLFSGWFAGTPVALAQYPFFAGLGLFAAFASGPIAIPFLLQAFQVPSDLFHLYPIANVVIGRFSVVGAAIQCFAVSLVCGVLLTGFRRMSKRRSLMLMGSTLGLGLAAILVTRAVLGWAIENEYTGDQAFVDRSLLTEPVSVQHIETRPATLNVELATVDRLELIQQRGILRVGYLPDRLPWVYRNNTGTAVGFDMEMAHRLARDLDVDLEIVRTTIDNAPVLLDIGYIDILMAGVGALPRFASQMAFSRPYMDLTAALAVPDHEQGKYSDIKTLQKLDTLTIGIPDRNLFSNVLHDLLPNAEFVDFETPRPFFRGEMQEVDALLMAAEGGSAWSLIYPQYAVAAPFGEKLRVPMAYGLPNDQPRWQGYIDSWVELNRRNGSIDLFFRYWVLGVEPVWRQQPRWSILRDVLGWGQDEAIVSEDGEQTETQTVHP
jgi:Na+/H+-dicarboxylate symporter